MRDCIIEYAENSIYEMIQFYFKNKKKQLATHKVYLINQLTYLMGLKDSWYNWDIDDYSAEELISFCFQQVYIAYDMKELYLENHKPGVIRQLERYFLLEQIDQRWKNHLQQMSLLREAVSWRSYGQQDPLMEYKNEAFFLFLSMHRYVRDKVVYSLLRTNLINK